MNLERQNPWSLLAAIAAAIAAAVVGFLTLGDEPNNPAGIPQAFEEPAQVASRMGSPAPGNATRTPVPGADASAPEAPAAGGFSAEDAGYLDPEELLPRYWGERWDEIAQEVYPDGIAAADLPPILEWSISGPHHLELSVPDSKFRVEIFYRKWMDWPGWEFHDDLLFKTVQSGPKLTAKSLAAALGVPPLAFESMERIRELEVEFAEMNRLRDQRVRHYIEQVSLAVRIEFDSNRVFRGPGKLPENRDFSKDLIYSYPLGAGGWTSRVRVMGKDYPDLMLLKNELITTREERRVRMFKIVAPIEPK